MNKKIILILSLVMVFSLLVGCSSKFSDIPKEDRQIYEEVYELYKYAVEMIEEDITVTEMFKDKKFEQLFAKYINKVDYPNKELEDFKIKLLGMISTYGDSDEDKEFAKEQFDDLKDDYYRIFK